MYLKELFKNHAWLSIKLTMERLYPDQIELIDDYETVFSELQTMQPVASNTTIDVHWVHDDYDDTDYVHVSGYYTNPAERTNEYSNSLAIEFVPWNEWLGMPIDENSVKNFSQLEIIANCLFEMTFIGFEQADIKAEMDNFKEITDDYDKMTQEERKKNTYTWDEVKEQLGINFEDETQAEEDDIDDK